MPGLCRDPPVVPGDGFLIGEGAGSATETVDFAGLPRFDIDVFLYWGSLGLAAAAVVLFLWLMRERRRND